MLSLFAFEHFSWADTVGPVNRARELRQPNLSLLLRVENQGYGLALCHELESAFPLVDFQPVLLLSSVSLNALNVAQLREVELLHGAA